jgi:hypothetical protein
MNAHMQRKREICEQTRRKGPAAGRPSQCHPCLLSLDQLPGLVQNGGEQQIDHFDLLLQLPDSHPEMPG